MSGKCHPYLFFFPFIFFVLLYAPRLRWELKDGLRGHKPEKEAGAHAPNAAMLATQHRAHEARNAPNGHSARPVGGSTVPPHLANAAAQASSASTSRTPHCCLIACRLHHILTLLFLPTPFVLLISLFAEADRERERFSWWSFPGLTMCISLWSISSLSFRYAAWRVCRVSVVFGRSSGLAMWVAVNGGVTPKGDDETPKHL